MAMDSKHELLQRPPSSLSKAEIQDFVAMVRAGGEVGSDVLEQNVRSAESLVTAHNKGECLIGVAALKRPTQSYRTKIEGKSGAKLDQAGFPFELGYVFVLPSARGQGLATRLCEAALAGRDSVNIFATTRVGNVPMAKALREIGFETYGQPYASGRGKYRLQLYVRRTNPVAPR
jgi:GNAT superfamily N-acetyltransferase